MTAEEELRLLRGAKMARDAGDKELEARILARLRGDEKAEPAPQTGQPLEHDFDALEMVKNIPGDAVNVAKQMANMVVHPIDTVEGLWNVVAGTAEKLWPGEQSHEKYANAVVDDLRNKYGGIEEFQRQLQTHPMETLLDASTVLTGGAGAARMAGAKGAKAAQAIVDVPGAVARVARAGWAKARGAGKPGELWESAIKPSTVLPYKERLKMADTALSERILPTKGGMNKLRDAKQAVGRRIGQLIDEAEASGHQFTIGELSNEVRKLQAEWRASASPGMVGNVASLRKFMNKWEMDLRKKRKIAKDQDVTLSPAETQKLKTDLYDEINFDAKRQTGIKSVEETQKALARGARQNLERIQPELAGVNERWGRLESLEPIMERAAGRISNRDTMGIGIGVNTAGGGVIGGAPGAAAGAVGGFLDRPLVKAIRAQRLYDALQPGFLSTPGIPVGLGAHNLGYLQDYNSGLFGGYE